MTRLSITPEQIAIYRASALRRREEERPELERRRELVWAAARHAARLLKERFQATRVVVFGSPVRGYGFNRWSDVDVAAWGIAPEDTFRAIGAVMDMDSDIPVNLVDVNTARPLLLEAVERDGIDL
jgi:predicted nucleotidyltransferase